MLAASLVCMKALRVQTRCATRHSNFSLERHAPSCVRSSLRQRLRPCECLHLVDSEGPLKATIAGKGSVSMANWMQVNPLRTKLQEATFACGICQTVPECSRQLWRRCDWFAISDRSTYGQNEDLLAQLMVHWMPRVRSRCQARIHLCCMKAGDLFICSSRPAPVCPPGRSLREQLVESLREAGF